MTLGLAALAVMALTAGSFYARSLFGYRTWRLLHYLTFGVFAMAAAHGIGAGTDTQHDWARYLYALTALVVFNLTAYRVLKGSARGLPEGSGPKPKATAR
jgi:sulfoxide reductase heme-binding subunit YedZ